MDPVSDEAAEIASVDVPAAGDLIKIESDTAGDYEFDDDSFFRWKLNGVLSSKTLVVLANTYTVAELVDELNDQLDFENDGIKFYATPGATAKLGLQGIWAYGPESEIELVSVQNAIYGGAVAAGNVTGLGTAMTQASVLGTTIKYPSTRTDDKFDIGANSNLQIVVDGTDNVNIDNVVQIVELTEADDRTMAEIVAEINDLVDDGTLPGGFVAKAVGGALQISTKHHGRDARIRIKPASTAEEVFDLSTTTAVGTSPSGVTGDTAIETFGRVTGSENDDDSVTFTVSADSAGIDGNKTKVKITSNIRDNNFTMEVYNNGVQLESWGNLTKNTVSRFYVETYIAMVSDWVRVTDNTDEGAGPADGTYVLTGGSDGIPSDPDKQDDLLVGEVLGFTGIYAVSEPEQIDIDLVAVPGHASTTVVTALLDLCQNGRMDCMAIIDPPFGLTVNEIIAWQNGTHPLNLTRFDSDFGAMYWPWVKIRDNFNQVDVWVPPSGSVMAVYARNDFLAKPWFAPAGLTRGTVPGITDVYNRPTLEERDLMYGFRNCINPIVQFTDFEGFVVWGQKTLQRRPTALDRVNVRRMMFYIEKRIRAASRVLIFDPHDDIFRSKFEDIADAILREVLVSRGLNAYIIKADEELNTPDVIDRNEFRARIGVQPIRAAEFIFIEFSVHRTGSFAENADTF